MKKRKFPAGLLIAFVVLLGGAGIYSAFNTKVANRTPEENSRILQEEQMNAMLANAPKQDPAATPAVPSAADVANSVKNASNSATAPGGEGGPSGTGRRGEPTAAPGTSILAPKAAPYKPIPNDSSTSSQWFEKKSGR